jgi:hypothetical protein
LFSEPGDFKRGGRESGADYSGGFHGWQTANARFSGVAKEPQIGDS